MSEATDEQPQTPADPSAAKLAFAQAMTNFAQAYQSHVQRTQQIDVLSCLITVTIISAHLEAILSLLGECGLDLDETFRRATVILEKNLAQLKAPGIVLANAAPLRRQ
jgi:hypothetical protein